LLLFNIVKKRKIRDTYFMPPQKHSTSILLLSLLFFLTGCLPANPSSQLPALAPLCTTQMEVINAFFDANDAQNYGAALGYLTDDAVVIFWAEGINGHHMGLKLAAGPDQIRPLLAQDGLRRNTGSTDQPNFKIEGVQQTGNQVFLKLTPDPTHPDGRPYDPYVLEMIFKGCKIDIIKLVERVTWV
jgi:hypothetical protein